MNIAGLRTPGGITAWITISDEVIACPECAGDKKDCPTCKGTGTVHLKVRVLAAHVNQDEWEAMKADATTTAIDPVTKESTETVDPVKFRHSVGRAVVKEWDGLTDGVDTAGNEIRLAVTGDNIDLLMDKWARFRVVVMSSPMDLTGMLAKQLEQQTKNC